MPQSRPASPVRATLFFSVSVFLLLFVGMVLRGQLGLTGVLLVQLPLFVGLAVFFALTMETRPLKEIFRLRLLSVQGVVKSIFLGLLVWGLAQVTGFLLAFLVQALGGELQPSYQGLLEAPVLYALLVGAFLPSIYEEAVFRGYLQWSLGPLGARAAVLLTGLLFGLMHLSLIRLLPLTILGMVFAAVVQRTGSILPGFLMHVVNNATVILLSVWVTRTGTAGSASPEPTWLSVAVLLTSAAGLGAAVWALSRSFGPGDLAESEDKALPEETAAPAVRPVERRAQAGLMLASLLPALLMYGWSVAYELQVTFGAR